MREPGGPVRDTIVGGATIPGRSAVAVVRWSGPGAFGVLDELTRGGAPVPRDRRAVLRRLRHPRSGEVIDEGLVTCFVGPRSYTGEDVVEFSGHGGLLSPELVIDAVVAAGARRAEPGEFTRRAYLLGRLDLVQAEAVQAVIDSRSRNRRRAALSQLSRALSDHIEGVRSELIQLEAQLAHHVDFPEEDDAPVPIEQLVRGARVAGEQLQALIDASPIGAAASEGILVVLAGRPNTGKSTLFNALLGKERALVTAQAGTTRDAVSVELDIGGTLVQLVDTAGLRDDADEVERLGIEVAKRYVASADLVLFCVDGDRTLADDEHGFLSKLSEQDQSWALVRTMADMGGPLGRATEWSETEAPQGRPPEGEPPVLRVSAHAGSGMAALKEHVASCANVRAEAASVPALIHDRQREGVDRAACHLRDFIGALGSGVPAEFGALHLQAARESLEEVVGVISPEAVLDRLFASFCIGK